MYIVRTYTALMHHKPTDKIHAVSTPIPFDNPHGYLGRLMWSSQSLAYRTNRSGSYQQSVAAWYPPDTDPHNHKYTYMPIGSSIHNTQYIRDFKN